MLMLLMTALSPIEDLPLPEEPVQFEEQQIETPLFKEIFDSSTPLSFLPEYLEHLYTILDSEIFFPAGLFELFLGKEIEGKDHIYQAAIEGDSPAYVFIKTHPELFSSYEGISLEKTDCDSDDDFLLLIDQGKFEDALGLPYSIDFDEVLINRFFLLQKLGRYAEAKDIVVSFISFYDLVKEYLLEEGEEFQVLLPKMVFYVFLNSLPPVEATQSSPITQLGNSWIKGFIAFEKGDYTSSIEYLEGGIQSLANCHNIEIPEEVYAMLAVSYFLLGDIENGAKYLSQYEDDWLGIDQALALLSTDPEKAISLLHISDDETMAALLLKYLGEPTTISSYSCYLAEDEKAFLEGDYEKVVSYNFQDPYTAASFALLGRYEEALALYSELLQKENAASCYIEARLIEKGLVQLLMGDKEGAIASLKAAEEPELSFFKEQVDPLFIPKSSLILYWLQQKTGN